VNNTYNRECAGKSWEGKNIKHKGVKGVPLHATKAHGGMEAFLMLVLAWVSGQLHTPAAAAFKERKQ
jgi:hypothetical protein